MDIENTPGLVSTHQMGNQTVLIRFQTSISYETRFHCFEDCM